MNEPYLAAAIVACTDTDRSANDIAVVADRRLSVAALAALLLNVPNRSVGQAARGVQAVREMLLDSRPIVTVVEGLAGDWPLEIDPVSWGGRTLLLLDPDDEPDAFVRAVRSRAQGYLARTASRQALEVAIETVATAGYYLDPVLAGRILWAAESSNDAAPSPRPELSERERSIVTRVASGLSSKEIAREYGVTPKTVRNHISNVYTKLNLHHRGQLVLYAAEEGLVPEQGPVPEQGLVPDSALSA